MSDGGAFRWAILGTGAVSGKFAAGLRTLSGSASLTAVASRDPANARAFAARFGGTAMGYKAAAEAPADAVYIATPPSEHEAHAMLAIGAGKPVLIEKPFASDAAAARRIAEAAEAAGVFCMEAMWTRFLPLLGAVRERLGVLGEIRALHGSFMGADVPDAGVSLFDPARGGGALMHRGIYPLSLARHLLGPIAEVQATGRIGATGVDEDCALTLTHASGAISTLSASLRAPGRNALTISGTAGLLEIVAPIFRPHRARLTPATPRKGGTGGGGRLGALRESGAAQRINQMIPAGLRGLGKGRTIRAPYAGNGYHYEAAEVARCLAAGLTASPLMPPAESVEIMQIVDAARAQFGSRP